MDVPVDTTTLNDGNHIPSFGLGVYQAESGEETERAVLHALRVGYRHIDTAEIYRNEESVGNAIQVFLDENKNKVSREDIFVTTKFFPSKNKGKEAVRAALEASLKKLQLKYVDLYLVHAPNATEKRLEQWEGMCDLKDEGLTKSIGVSNYGVHHLEELFSSDPRYTPVINQLEINPYITREELVEYCLKKGVAVEAYSPLTKGEKLNDPKLLAIASQYKLSGAQVLIKWCLQKGYVVIPKSVTPSRIEENAAITGVEISAEHMKELDGFDEYFVTGWDPTKSK